MLKEDAAMSSKTVLLGAALAILGLVGSGCAGAPSDVRIQGVPVPSAWIERAESGTEPKICLALSRKLWDRDVLESLRYLHKGVLLRDPECFRQYLAYAQTPSLNLSQRVYARLFVEKLLRQAPVVTSKGEDIRGELYYQLCWAWRYTEPRCPAKVKQVLQSMLEHGAAPAQENSPFIAQLIRETGLRREAIARKSPPVHDIRLYAADHAEENRAWLRVPLNGDRREGGDWVVSEANAWGGGSDRLLTDI